MRGVVTVEGDEEQVRTARQVLAGRGFRVVSSQDAPAGAASPIRARRVKSTAFDGYEVLVVHPEGKRKVWGSLASTATGGSEAMLVLSLLEFLEGYIDPSPEGGRATPRRRRRARFARAG
jgi:hypothetical protein